MCQTEPESVYSKKLIKVAMQMLPKGFEHDICEVSGEIRYDGKRVRIVVNKRDKWIQIGCTRVTFVAMEALNKMCEVIDEVVVQAEQLLPVHSGQIINFVGSPR